ncbi:MAG: hypothetical protein QM730_08105 [Anaerolineales bacterium]
MTKKLLLFFVVTTLLIGCGPVTPVHPVPTMTLVIPTATATLIPEPIIKFLSPNLLFDKDEPSMILNVGIYALNKEITFLIGAIGSSSGNQQSVLLRSIDDGQHWQEVMSPQKGSDVIDFQILETGEGWALIMWTVEGPGTPILFHTTDYGATWRKLSEIPKQEWFSVPANMLFFDDKNGQMVIATMGGLNDNLSFITTFDGGLTWKEAGRYSPSFENYETQVTALATLYQANQKNFSQSTSLDYSSKWKLEDTDKSIIIYRQLYENYSWSNWEIVNTLPKLFDYKDGQIIIP